MTEKEKTDNKKEIPILVPSEIDRIYSTGVYGGHTAYDFRLLFFTEEPLEQDEVVKLDELKVVREVLAEVILSPLAAKQTAEWLTRQVKKFEDEIGVIPSPSKNREKN